jgi:CBS domain-containing protein
MRTIHSVRRSAVGIAPDATVRSAARLMEQAGVGALAVVDHDQLLGIVTDRDLVRRALAPGLPEDARIDGVMSTPVVTIDADADVQEAFSILRGHDVRRLPVVRDGRFVGMVTVDDLLVELAADLDALVGPVRAEVAAPQHDSPVPARI